MEPVYWFLKYYLKDVNGTKYLDSVAWSTNDDENVLPIGFVDWIDAVSLISHFCLPDKISFSLKYDLKEGF